MIRVENISKSFDGKKILDNLTLEIEKGTFVSILGASGSGKTTLLRIIAMLESFDKGNVHINGWTLSKQTKKNSLEARRALAFVFQKPIALNTTVFENIAIGLRIRGIEKDIIEAKTKKTLQQVGIAEEFFTQNALTLSGGELQRIALARAVITQPKILLLDEPTAHLDEENAQRFEEVLQQLRKNGMIIIMATHDKAQAKRLSDIQYTLNKGKLKVIS